MEPTQAQPAKEKEKSVGGVWVRTSQGGKDFLGIQVTIDGVKHNLIAFRNGFKKEDKHPDYQIYVSRPRQ